MILYLSICQRNVAQLGSASGLGPEGCRFKSCHSDHCLWGHSSAGRAPALHAGGQGFDPPWLHHFFIFYGGIAQLARASGSYPAGRRFKSHRRYHSARWSRGQDTALSRRNHGFDSRTGHHFRGRERYSCPRSFIGDLAQLVRAFASHARGHGFESPSLHHKACNRLVAGFFLLFYRNAEYYLQKSHTNIY